MGKNIGLESNLHDILIVTLFLTIVIASAILLNSLHLRFHNWKIKTVILTNVHADYANWEKEYCISGLSVIQLKINSLSLKI